MENLLKKLFDDDFLIYAVMSRRELKITIRPCLIRSLRTFQFTKEENNKASHKNLDKDAAQVELLNLLDSFKEVHFFTKEADFHGIKTKTGSWKLLKKRALRAFRQSSIIGKRITS